MMKKQIRYAVAIFILCGVFLTACAAGNGGSRGVSSYRYDNADKYIAGGAVLNAGEVKQIKNLDIGWVSGEVEIIYHPEETIIFSEDSPAENDESLVMRYWVDGDTLRIRFAESGEFKLQDLEKSLTVHLPELFVLGGFEVDTASAGVIAHGLKATRGDIDTVSGTIDLADAEMDRFSADTTSGAISVMFAEPLGELELDTVSGEICVTVTELGEFDIDSTSGGVNLSAGQAPASGEINTVSGSVELILPETAEFTAEINTVSGQMESDFSLAKRGDEYSCGSGACRYEIDTTSGNISFRLQ